METTIQVQSATVNGDWCNINTTDGKKVSVNMPKCPKLSEAIKTAQTVPYSLTGELATKDGKTYLWEPKPPQAPKRPFGGQPRNEDLILAQTCIKSSCEYYAQRKADPKDVTELADSLFAWCKAKSNTI